MNAYQEELDKTLKGLIAEQEKLVKILAEKEPEKYAEFLDEVPERIVSMVMRITSLSYPMALAITATVWLDGDARKGMKLEDHPKSEFGHRVKWYAETNPLVIAATKITFFDVGVKYAYKN